MLRKVKMLNNDNGVSQVGTPQSEPEREKRIFTFKASQWIWLVLYVVEVLIVLRIVLKLMGANPDSPIVVMIYGFTSLFLIPFVGLVGSPTRGGMVLEVSSIFAIGIYALIAVAVERLVWLIFYRPRRPATRITETTTSEQHTTP
jgi:YggT family protein